MTAPRRVVHPERRRWLFYIGAQGVWFFLLLCSLWCPLGICLLKYHLRRSEWVLIELYSKHARL